MDPILGLLMGLISGTRDVPQSSATATGTYGGGPFTNLEQFTSPLFNMGRSSGGSSIPQDFWSSMFGEGGLSSLLGAMGQQQQTQAAPQTSIADMTRAGTINPNWETEGGWGGQVTNPDYTAAWGNTPYEDYLARWRKEQAAARAAYDAETAKWGDPNAINPATGRRWGRRMAFNAGNPITQYVAQWVDPHGVSTGEDNAFLAAGRGVQPYLPDWMKGW
jgi:hypothetical protein